MTAPLAIDLFCGLGGWTDGLLAEGWDVVGFDIERHQYDGHGYRAQLVLQDARTIHGRQLRDAQLIVASSPCQEFSYRAMPWKRAKALPPPVLGMELFAQAARIQREAIEAAGRWIPMIQENVRGAQPWVGRAPWHFGSYYLWGDIPALMPSPHRARKRNPDRVEGQKGTGGSWFGVSPTGVKQEPNNPARGVAIGEGVKSPGADWSRFASTGEVSPHWRLEAVKHSAPGTRENGKGSAWFGSGPAANGSKSNARKRASAEIAKIPFALASHIAHVYYPRGDHP